MFVRKHEKLAPLLVFIRRLVGSVAIAGILIVVALLIGIMGYHHIAQLGWVDSILEASMILGGMGPVNSWLRQKQNCSLPVMRFLVD
jgi:hypothetical protein